MGWSSTSQVTMIGTLLTLDGQLFSGIFSLVTCYLSHSGIFLFAGQSLLGEGRGAARCASVSTQYTSAEVYSQISCTTSIPTSSWNIVEKRSNVENVGWTRSSAWTLLAPQQFRVYADCAVSAVPADCKYRKTQTFCKIISQVQIWQNYIYWVRILFIVIIKSYRRAIWAKRWTDVFLFSSRTSTLASWTLSWPFWSLFTGTGDFKKGFKFLKTKYRHTKMRRHVVLAMDVSVFLLKTIGIPQKFHKVVMTIGQVDPNIALIIYINDIFWILFDCKVNMCDWLTAPTSRDLSGTSDLHENIIFWIILREEEKTATVAL